MKAFIEWHCEHSGVVRVGPDCTEHGKDFDFAVAFKREGSVAIIKALVTKPALPLWLKWLPVRPFTQQHAKAMIQVLRDAGLIAEWERVKKNRWFSTRRR
jgi:hypothetical protein